MHPAEVILALSRIKERYPLTMREASYIDYAINYSRYRIAEEIEMDGSMNAVCPKCKRQVDEDALYCARCGQKLD